MPHSTMITGMNLEGRKRLSKMLVNGSKIEYAMKNNESAAMYWLSDTWISVWRPSTLALPMFERSARRVRESRFDHEWRWTWTCLGNSRDKGESATG
nr:hypothetical protein CFP56_72546 [Quercus suber]